MKLQRTHTCGQLRSEHVGETVILNGWVDAIRDHGGVVFLELRDRYGSTQAMIDPGTYEAWEELRPEFVVAVRGEVAERPESMRNAEKPTGDIEVHVREVEVLNTSKVPPFEVLDEIEARDELRLKHRYVDMRRPKVRDAIVFRSQLVASMRRVLEARDFLDVETPVLMKTSPEGARDFVVPTRHKPGWVYALPQSPQLFKQTLMVCGLDRYYQICKCFRDEDLRADRQPEFTQLDLEMSFVRQEDVFEVVEEVIQTAYRELLGIEVPRPFERLTYHEAMEAYGIDKPDRRFGLRIQPAEAIFEKTEFKVFRSALDAGGVLRMIVAKGGASLSRKQISALEGVAKEYGAGGLPWTKIGAEGVSGGIAKFVGEAETAALREVGAEEGDLLVFACDRWTKALTVLGQVRLALGQALDLIDAAKVDAHFVTDFPLFEWNEDEERWQAMHHMFTAPRGELPPPGEDLSEVRADLYDLVINGSELGSGSIRIHRPEVQRQIFRAIGLSEEEAQAKFGWFLRALDYGAPPHGGIALGLDRLAMIMVGADSLREVIAFPKTTSGACPLTESPSAADAAQWEELGLEVRPRPEAEPKGG